ncbi:MAG: Spy/CpxP family protein refolding chaperone [Bradyrhizobium sp.]|uniref:Spy/CpxP family protein refolding chaperone n=1 Tax=Bradyrhizobium sp. TaxID=376 RepID=UPI0025B8974E|nr:Spy/CpxP family protein refolding chaperone [Bradyrhizobium sp.]MBI5260283.1 Spy/CpxP family protein refolding chaperone [Bradyrhizobium sp.]
MMSLTRSVRALLRWCIALGSVVVLLLGVTAAADAQGLVKGVQEGAAAGNKAAGPVGGVLGGAIGGVVGAVTGVLGVVDNKPAAPSGNKPQGSSKTDAKADPKSDNAKGNAKSANSKSTGPTGANSKGHGPTAAKAGQPPAKQLTVLTQEGEPQLTAEQIVANSDAYIERIKTELNLTPEQEKHWYNFSSAMHYLGHNGAERLNLRVARAKRDPPDDIVEQMRNEAQFLVDRAADQRSVADAAEPLYATLDDKQKQIFIQQMVRLSHERGLD